MSGPVPKYKAGDRFMLLEPFGGKLNGTEPFAMAGDFVVVESVSRFPFPYDVRRESGERFLDGSWSLLFHETELDRALKTDGDPLAD